MGIHFKDVCKECGTVVRQCRCFNASKSVTLVVCDECKKREENAESA